MKLRYLWCLVLLMCGALVFSCAGPSTQVAFQASDLQANKYVPKVNNFLIVFDASSSMASGYDDKQKLAIAKALAESMIQTVPELRYTAGLRTFGHCLSVTEERTLLVYGMTNYSASEMGSAVEKITCAGGNTPLGYALEAAGADLEAMPGKSAIIVISDGQDLLGGPEAIASQLAADYGNKLCIYTIQVGDDAAGASALEKIAGSTGCGFATNADNLASAGEMGNYVEKVFLAPAPPRPVAKAPAPVADVFKDSDGDGVPDNRDRCPDTPRGAQVDANGCWIIGKIHFDLDSAKIRPDAIPVLDEVADVLKKNPGLSMKIDGFTCDLGSESYNLKLSRKRAQAAKEYLVKQGISSDRFSPEGNSYHMPIAPNDSEQHRKMNRRVEFTQVR